MGRISPGTRQTEECRRDLGHRVRYWADAPSAREPRGEVTRAAVMVDYGCRDVGMSGCASG